MAHLCRLVACSGRAGRGNRRSNPQRLPQLIVLLFLLVDPLWGNIWGGLTASEALPRIRQSVLRRRPWMPYLRSDSPAARLFGQEGAGVHSILARAWLPGVAVAFVVAFAIGPPAVWTTLVVLCVSVGNWIQRHVPVFPTSVLHSLVIVAGPWILGLTIFGLDPWSDYHWAIISLVDSACMGREPLLGGAQCTRRSVGRLLGNGAGAVWRRAPIDSRPSSTAADSSGHPLAGHLADDPSWPATRQHSVLVDGGHADPARRRLPKQLSDPATKQHSLRNQDVLPRVRAGSSPTNRACPSSDNPPFEDGHRREIKNGKQESTGIPESPAQAGRASQGSNITGATITITDRKDNATGGASLKHPATSALHVDSKMDQNGRLKISCGGNSDKPGQMDLKCATLKSATGWGNKELESESQERRMQKPEQEPI